MTEFTQAWVDAQNSKRRRRIKIDVPVPVFSEPENKGPVKPKLSIVLRGKIMGGKNGILITRIGHRYPNPKWEKWRNEQVASVRSQLPEHFHTIDTPSNVRLTYWAGDMRRRDMPAIIDAIWHVLEKAEVVKDDVLLWVMESSRLYSKESPGALVEFL